VNCNDQKEPLPEEPGADVVTDFLSSVAQPAPPTAGSVPSEEYSFAAEPSSFIFQKKNNPLSWSSPPASIANSNLSCADAVLPLP